MDDKARDLLEEEIAAEISAAVEKAEQYQPDLMEPFRHCFASMPNYLEGQLAEFQAFVDTAAGETKNSGHGSQLSGNVH